MQHIWCSFYIFFYEQLTEELAIVWVEENLNNDLFPVFVIEIGKFQKISRYLKEI